MKKRIIALLLGLSMLLVACINNNGNGKVEQETQESNKETSETMPESKGSLKIVTSFFPIYDLAKGIVGDKAEVVNLTKTGSAHGFEPSVQDMEDIVKSDLLIVNGAHFESWIDKVKDENLNILTMSDFVDVKKAEDDHDHDHEHKHEDDHDHDHEHKHEDDHDHDHEDDHDHDHEHEHDHDHGGVDPHFWTNPANARKMLKAIKDKIVEIDSENKEFYEKNYEELDKKFDQLASEYDEALKKYNGKHIVVPHKAFSYIFDPYNIEQIAMAGINSTDDPNTGRIAEIIKEMKENNIKTVFYEYGHSDKVAQTIANEVNGTVKPITTLEVINEEDINKGETLVSLMKMNIDNIVEYFEGK